MGELIAQLPGRKHIFTNGDVPHAERTIAALEIEGRFDRIFDIADADFVPKPERRPYDKFLADHAIDPKFSAMFEDMPRNLEVPKMLGMSTILVVAQNGSEHSTDHPREKWELDGMDGEHIDHVSDNLNEFISAIVEAL